MLLMASLCGTSVCLSTVNDAMGNQWALSALALTDAAVSVALSETGGVIGVQLSLKTAAGRSISLNGQF